MISKIPSWAKNISKKLKIGEIPAYSKQPKVLSRGVKTIADARPESFRKIPLSVRRLVLTEQPFDLELLGCSPLFRHSRVLFFESGGLFIPSLLSSPRSLTSTALLENWIEYSPIETELIWAATDPLEIKTLKRLADLRTYSTSLFHEQNHRVLWKILPPPDGSGDALRKYLNFVESLVITLDMALADQLGPSLARFFYLSGVTYDPGTTVYQEIDSQRNYRNYLHAALHATYMNLENYLPEDIPMVIEALFPSLGEFAVRAAKRSGNLDREFIEGTNAFWQEKHGDLVYERLCHTKTAGALNLPDDPLDNCAQYLIAEKYFEWMGL